MLAHTDFESSSPADGDVVDIPIDTVRLVFTAAATPVGDQFVALDVAGQIRAPASVGTDDDKTFVLSFDPPLAAATSAFGGGAAAGAGPVTHIRSKAPSRSR